MSQNISDDKSTLVQVMACCHQAASHYLSQCWPRSLMPYGVIRPQWVKNGTAEVHGESIKTLVAIMDPPWSSALKVYNFLILFKDNCESRLPQGDGLDQNIKKMLNTIGMQAMTCCLVALSHYLNQCWLINYILRHFFNNFSTWKGHRWLKSFVMKDNFP